ncbi:MAG: F0F1 ATP synthase subunit A [Defluviitaleaceae bacterium]|nr:F0F1 ATP synthase subunit A [Defluviitaleaceae bacterium]MCL2275446.1 F0F1 ATP synthase subunit A [Defluviitaleaceae bacterium]
MFDVAVPIHGVVNIFGFDLWITNTIVVSWVVSAILLTFAIVARIKLKSFTDKPKGFQNVVEMMVGAFDGFMKSNGTPKIQWMGGWFFTLFAFLLISNIFGLLPGQRPPTADWPLPFALALTSFFFIQFSGIRHNGWGYIKRTYLSPHPVFLPVNILGEFSRPISLSFRLFGNILGGLILVSLIYGIAPVIARFAIPVALHLIFDLAFGALQAFIFTILSLTFVGLAAAES